MRGHYLRRHRAQVALALELLHAVRKLALLVVRALALPHKVGAEHCLVLLGVAHV